MVFEERGLPAAAILTEPFVPTARALASLHRMPDYDFVVLPHPITSLTLEQVAERADWATEAVERLLTSGPEPVTSGPEPNHSPESDADRVARLVEELAQPLRADGADLTFSVDRPERLTLSLEVSGAACSECILPGSYLRKLYAQRLRQALGPGWTLRLDDPREGRDP